MKKRTHKALSWLLTVAIVLGMLPAMSLTAAAVEEEGITINASTGDSSGSGWSYTKSTGFLQLNNYNGGPIEISGVEITLFLTTGTENTITVNTTYNSYAAGIVCDNNNGMTITGSGKLTINATSSGEGYTKAVLVNGDLTMQSGEIVINASSEEGYVCGVDAGAVSVKGDSKLTVNTTTGTYYAYAIDATSLLVESGAQLDVNMTAENPPSGFGGSGLHTSGNITLYGTVNVTANGSGISGIVIRHTVADPATGCLDIRGGTTIQNAACGIYTDTAVKDSLPYDVYVRGGTLNISSTRSGSQGIKCEENGVFVDSTTTIRTDAECIVLPAGNTDGSVVFPGQYPISLTSANNRPINLGDDASSNTATRTISFNFGSGGSLTAVSKSTNADYKTIPIGGYVTFGSNNWLMNGRLSTDTSQISSNGRLILSEDGTMKVAYSADDPRIDSMNIAVNNFTHYKYYNEVTATPDSATYTIQRVQLNETLSNSAGGGNFIEPWETHELMVSVLPAEGYSIPYGSYPNVTIAGQTAEYLGRTSGGGYEYSITEEFGEYYYKYVNLLMDAPAAGVTMEQYVTNNIHIEGENSLPYSNLEITEADCYDVTPDSEDLWTNLKSTDVFKEGHYYNFYMTLEMKDSKDCAIWNSGGSVAQVNGEDITTPAAVVDASACYEYVGMTDKHNGYIYVAPIFQATAAPDGITVYCNAGADHLEGPGWTWSKAVNILTLENYNGGPIKIYGGGAQTVEIALKGDNNTVTVTEATGTNYCAGIEVVNASEVTFSSSGMLNVNVNVTDPEIVNAYGLYMNHSSIGSGDVIMNRGKLILSPTVSTTNCQTYGINTPGDVTVGEDATLRIYSTSCGGTHQTVGIYSIGSGAVSLDGTVEIQQTYAGTGTAGSNWSSIYAKTISIGIAAEVTVQMPQNREHGLYGAKLAAKSNSTIGSDWTKTDAPYRYFENDDCLVTVTDQNGDGNYESFRYENIPYLVFVEDGEYYGIPAGKQGTIYTGLALEASGGSGEYSYALTGEVPDGLSINEANQLVYTRPNPQENAIDVTVQVTDKAGYSKTITVTVGAVEALTVTDGISISGTTGDTSGAGKNGGTWSYVKSTRTLTLNSYKGGGIYANGFNTLNVVLVGDSVVDGNVLSWATGIYCDNCNLNISGNGSLIINSTQTGTNQHARAVIANTITQNGGDVTVNVASAFWHHALRAQTGIFINGGKLTVNATNNNSAATADSQLVRTETGEILVGEDAELTVNVTNNSRDCSDIAIYNAASATTDTTNNGDINIRGKVTIIRTADSIGTVSGIVNASTQNNTDGVITISDGADVTITNAEYAIAPHTREKEGLSDIVITGGKLNITSGISGSVGLESDYNGISITGGTVNVSTDAIALNLDYGYNKKGIINISGNAVVDLLSANSYAVHTCDTTDSTRVHTIALTSGGSFRARSNGNYPIQAYFQLDPTNDLAFGSLTSSKNAGGGYIIQSSSVADGILVVYTADSALTLTEGTAQEGPGYTWDGTKLILNGYNAGPIVVSGTSGTGNFEVQLVGNGNIIKTNTGMGNTIYGIRFVNTESATFTGTGMLSVNVTANTGITQVYGIQMFQTGTGAGNLNFAGGTVCVNSTKTGTETGTVSVYGVSARYVNGTGGTITVAKEAALEVTLYSNSTTSAIALLAYGDVALNGQVQIEQHYTGDSGAPTNQNWKSVNNSSGGISIGTDADITVTMPTGVGNGLSSASLEANGGQPIGDGWTNATADAQYFENEVCLVTQSDQYNGSYAEYGYCKLAAPLTFEDSAAYDIPAGNTGAAYTASTPLTATGGSGSYVYELTGTIPSGLSINGENKLTYARTAAAGATTATVKVTDLAGISKTIDISVGAVTDGVYPSANAISINGHTFASPSSLYYTNGADDTGNDSVNYNAHYDPATGILELKGYEGGSIRIGDLTGRGITIKLVGKNTITTTEQFGLVQIYGGPMVITAEDSGASLTINNTGSTTSPSIGIASDYSNTYPSNGQAITIGGNATVVVNATATSGDQRAFGIYTPGTVSIEGNASFTAVVKSNILSGAEGAGAGIYTVKGTKINTNGTVNVDTSECGEYSYAIMGQDKNELTKAGSMTLKWKQNASGYGGPVSFANCFDSAQTTHAINVDNRNCIATYRYGTPYTVTVTNGSCDAVNRRYLQGDKVSITAATLAVPFTNWTSADVTVDNANSATTTFTMPSKDTTVTANYNAFTVQPYFTRETDTTGIISFTMYAESDAIPRLVTKDGDYNDVVGNAYFYDTNGTGVLRTRSVSKGGNYEVIDGEYRVAVQYGTTWLYSDVFKVDYSGLPAPTFTPASGGSFTDSLNVSISVEELGALIYYTTDNTDPQYSDTRKKLDGSSVMISDSCTIQARAYTDSKGWGELGTATYTKVSAPAAPTASKPSGSFTENFTLYLESSTAGANIFYTTDGTTPTSSSTMYNGISGIAIAGNVGDTITIKAIAVNGGYSSEVATFTYTKAAGVTVSGTAVSWNNTDNAVYLLYDSSTSDADIKADMKLASPEKALSYTATKGGITQNADGTRSNQEFSFSTVEAGTYKLAIFKPGKYVPKIMTIAVADTNVALGEVKLWLFGDVTYDGRIRTGDATQILKYIAKTRTFTDEEFLAADITQDGNIRTGDATQIKRYIAKANSQFDSMP